MHGTHTKATPTMIALMIAPSGTPRCTEPKWMLRVPIVPLVTLMSGAIPLIQEGMKRTVQVNVKMTQEDAELFQKAAEKRWPDAVMTNSGIVLALARIAARETLAKRK